MGVCPVCQFSYGKNKSDKINHYESCLKAFHCSQCGEKFVSGNKYEIHFLLKHKMNAVDCCRIIESKGCDKPLAIENRVRRHIKKCTFFKEWLGIHTPLAFYKEPKSASVLREFIGKPVESKNDQLQDALKKLEECQRKKQKLRKKIKKLETDLSCTIKICESLMTKCSQLEQKTVNSFCLCKQ